MWTSRRRFIQLGAGAACALCSGYALLQATGCAGETTDPPDDEGWVTIAIADHATLAEVGGMAVLAVEGTDVTIAIVRTTSSTFAALAGLCTHQGCELAAYDFGTEELICPCHDSHFTLDGAVAAGPALEALAVYPTEYDEGAAEIRIQVGS